MSGDGISDDRPKSISGASCEAPTIFRFRGIRCTLLCRKPESTPKEICILAATRPLEAFAIAIPQKEINASVRDGELGIALGIEDTSERCLMPLRVNAAVRQSAMQF